MLREGVPIKSEPYSECCGVAANLTLDLVYGSDFMGTACWMYLNFVQISDTMLP